MRNILYTAIYWSRYRVVQERKSVNFKTNLPPLNLEQTDSRCMTPCMTHWREDHTECVVETPYVMDPILGVCCCSYTLSDVLSSAWKP